MSQLALYLFGTPRLELDGMPVHISRRKAMALLAYLAATGRLHNRDSLAALLWPENDQSSARGGLRRMLSEIKGSIGDGWFATDRETAQLITHHDLSTGKSFWLDVTAFQENINICEAHNHPPTVTCPECLPALESAVALYQDDFMTGFSLKDCPAYDEWQFFQAEELSAHLTSTLVRLSSHYANERTFETAINYARRWLALDQLHEPAHQQLMRLYDLAGKRAAAIRQYQICRLTLADEIGVDPSEDTKTLYQSIQANTMAAARDLRPSSNLPVQATPFIGRTNEMAEIQAKLSEDECRLLTLLGPGGSGKTRLAIETAGQLLENFKQGVFFVDLAPLEEADLIPSTIATAIKFPLSNENTPGEQLLEYLQGKEILLILDNFEHLRDGIGFVNRMMIAAPDIKILVTSRTRLMVSGEHIYDVWGMSYPEDPVSIEIASHQYSAVQLFESEANRVQGDFKLNEENLSNVIRVCSLLEGMPLGIVLAASWIKMLNPEEIADEITRDLEFLEAEIQDLPRRQRSMQSVFNYSWRLLSSDEQKNLSALSVFRGGFTREAAHIVAGVSLRVLKGLIDQSMLYVTPNGRYEVHELVRQYAAEKLAIDPTTEDEIQGIHSDHFCQALAGWEPDLQRWKQAEIQQEMMLEIDNIRTAWTRAVERLSIKLLMDGINGLCIFYDRKNQRIEGEAICHSLTERLDAVHGREKSNLGSHDQSRMDQINRLKLHARAMAWGGFFNMRLGNVDRALSLLQKCLVILESDELADQDNRFEKGVAYAVLPAVMDRTQRDETERLAEEAVQLFRSLDDESWAFFVSLFLTTYLEIIVEERWYFDEIRTITRKMGDLKGMANRLEGLSYGQVSNFKFEQAEESLCEALAISTELDDRHKVVSINGTLGWQWIWQGRYEEARSLFHETLTAFSDLDYSQSISFIIHAHLGYPDLYLGEYQIAREHAQHASEVLRDAKHFKAGLLSTYSLDILGKAALAEGSYAEADGYFQDCMLVFQTYDHREKISTTLACLGYIARAKNEVAQAQGYFYQALEMAIEAIEGGGSLPTLAHTLPGIALLFADLGDYERAVEGYSFASKMGMVANSQWFADVAGNELAKVTADLPAEMAEAAKDRAQAPVSWESAAELLAELEEMGWGESVLLGSTD